MLRTQGASSGNDGPVEGLVESRYTAEESGEELAEIVRLIDAGLVKPTIFKTFSLAQAVEAQALVKKGHTRGNVVLNTA